MSFKAPTCFVGLGAMGAGMAANLAKAGVPLTVYDLRPEAMQALVQYGAKPSNSLAEAAKDVEVLVLMVINEAQAKQVLLEAEVLQNMRTSPPRLRRCPPEWGDLVASSTLVFCARALRDLQ